MQFEVVQGDIAKMEVDASVTGATTTLRPDEGGPRALKYAAGLSEVQECDEKGPIGLGEAVETGAHDLDAEYVVHAAVREPAGDVRESVIRDATANALGTADACGCESIALPVLGRAPVSEDSPTLERRASCTTEAIPEYEPTTLTTVFVVSGTDGELDEYAHVIDSVRKAARRTRKNYQRSK